MELYILKSVACLFVFFLFYKTVLEYTSLHTLKRFYLLGTIIFSIFIPFITFTSYVEVSQTMAPVFEGGTITYISSEVETPINYLPIILWTIYYLGVAFFSFKFIRNITEIIQKIRKNPVVKKSNIFHVLLKQRVTPHTFLSYIFLNKERFEKQEIPKAVLLHEETHALQKHSLDILFIEIIRIIFWFNPLIWLLKHSIKLNHEFLADRAVLNNGTETSEYQNILLAFSSNAFTPALAHSITYSSIKKRFKIMKTHTSKSALWLKSLLLLPLLAVVIYGFSSKEVVEKYTANNEQNVPEVNQKATPGELAEYNKLAKQYNAVAIQQRIIKKKDLERLEIIYRKMSPAQKENAQPFPECLPPPPPPPPVPDAPKAPSSENGNLYMVPQAPPPPNPNPVDYIKELARRGATFYIGPHKYSVDEAIEMVKKSTNKTTIDVSKYPEVHLDGC